MAGQRGVAAFKQRAKEKAAGGGRSADVFNLQVKDGEEALVRFLGLFRKPRSEKILKVIAKVGDDELQAFADLYGARIATDEKGNPKETLLEACVRRMTQEEPVLSGTHWIKGTSKVCAHSGTFEGIAGCVYCWKKDQGDRSIRAPREVFCFTVFDLRKYHRVQGEDEGDKNQYKPCTEDEGRCKLCAKASDKGRIGAARVNGVRKFVTGRKWANAIIAQDDSLKKKCRSCGVGKIRLEGYACGNPECCEPLDDCESDDAPHRCAACEGKTYPVEMLKCTKCEDAVRGSIADVDVMVTRAGAGKDDTVYGFVPQGFSEFPEEYRKFAYVIDWNQAQRPEPTAQQAAALGLARDPFGTKGRVGSEDYDEEEEKPKKKPAKRKPADDDDDDDVVDD